MANKIKKIIPFIIVIMIFMAMGVISFNFISLSNDYALQANHECEDNECDDHNSNEQNSNLASSDSANKAVVPTCNGDHQLSLKLSELPIKSGDDLSVTGRILEDGKKYYLDKDMVINARQEKINAYSEKSLVSVTICLNGKKISNSTSSTYIIFMEGRNDESAVSMQIVDCGGETKTKGTIEATGDGATGIFIWSDNTTLKMYGGLIKTSNVGTGGSAIRMISNDNISVIFGGDAEVITDNNNNEYASGIKIGFITNSKFEMIGGKITATKGGGCNKSIWTR